jgi:ribose/xylose/arabinose/galactoside ABC-type transport system permease subunit
MKSKITGIIGSAWGQRISILVFIMIVMAIFEPRFFLPRNVSSILLAIAIYGILACGMLFVVLSGGIDLSLGSTAAMAACITTKTFVDSGYTMGGLLLGFTASMALCALLGLFHGIEITIFRMPAFVLTLATKYAIYGLMQIYTNGRYITPQDKGLFYLIGNARPLGIPMPVIIMLLCILISAIVLAKTPFGRRIYAVGGNPVAARLVGINAKRYTVYVYIICSLFAGLGGVVLASFNMVANQSTASGYEGAVLTAMVIGGINVFGGEGGVGGAFFGALFVGIIDNVLILLGVPSEYQKFTQGVIIIAAIAFNMWQQRRSLGLTKRRLRKKEKEGVMGEGIDG